MCSSPYKTACDDDQFSKPFKSYIGQDAVHKFITNMVEESKFCSRVMKEHFNKKLLMTNEDDKTFESSTKCWICNNTFVEGDIKVTDHCRITGKYRSAEHRDCIANVNLNYKTHIVFHNLKYGHVIM